MVPPRSLTLHWPRLPVGLCLPSYCRGVNKQLIMKYCFRPMAHWWKWMWVTLVSGLLREGKLVLSIQRKSRRCIASVHAFTNSGWSVIDWEWEGKKTGLLLCVADFAWLTVCVHRVWIVMAQKAQQLLNANCGPQVSWQLMLCQTPEQCKSE